MASAGKDQEKNGVVKRLDRRHLRTYAEQGPNLEQAVVYCQLGSRRDRYSADAGMKSETCPSGIKKRTKVARTGHGMGDGEW